jgi:hypothetical protein
MKHTHQSECMIILNVSDDEEPVSVEAAVLA